MAVSGVGYEVVLTLDIGNTTSHFGIFRNNEVLRHWKVSSRETGTADEYWVFVRMYCEASGLESPGAVVMASVVPGLTQVYSTLFRERLNLEPVVVSGDMRLGIELCVDRPSEVGGDRIANSVAAASIYNSDVIVVDLGTATTFDVISREKEYLGGVIAPGIETSASRLIEKTARLPEVEFHRVERVIGRNTEDAMRSGIFYGTVSQIDGIIMRIMAEWGRSPLVVATGGLAPLVSSASETISEMDPLLTLKGLNVIYTIQEDRR